MTKYFIFDVFPKIPYIVSIAGKNFELPPPDAQRARATLYHIRHTTEDKLEYSKHCSICLEVGSDK